jgi:hypothetical protein
MNFTSGNNQSSASTPYNQFNPSNKYMPSSNSTSEFLNSNSLVAKIAFILFILFAFVILLQIGISCLTWYFNPQSNPKLINGMVDASQSIIIPQDPSSIGALTIPRSQNATDGIEFTWSVWIYIDNMTTNAGKYKCVFYKGNDYTDNPDAVAGGLGLNFPNNAPGLYIAPDKNDLVILMNTFDVINEEIKINDIPLNKWVNVIIRLQNTNMDVYINGTITKSHKLHGVPKQNYGDVYVAMQGGFGGNISNLWYYDHAVGTAEIEKIASSGPDLTVKGDLSVNVNNTDYLSLRWFFSGMNE